MFEHPKKDATPVILKYNTVIKLRCQLILHGKNAKIKQKLNAQVLNAGTCIIYS